MRTMTLWHSVVAQGPSMIYAVKYTHDLATFDPNGDLRVVYRSPNTCRRRQGILKALFYFLHSKRYNYYFLFEQGNSATSNRTWLWIFDVEGDFRYTYTPP